MNQRRWVDRYRRWRLRRSKFILFNELYFLVAGGTVWIGMKLSYNGKLIIFRCQYNEGQQAESIVEDIENIVRSYVLKEAKLCSTGKISSKLRYSNMYIKCTSGD